MYNLTRQEVADMLQISTRSVDRYVKSGKIRSEKRGKIIYIHQGDVENMSPEGQGTPEVIVPKKQSYSEKKSTENPEFISQSKEVSTKDTNPNVALEKVYFDLREEIKNKDKTIQELSVELGQAREIAKNSVSVVEFKKSQFLLEESKSHMSGELSKLKKQTLGLQKKLKYEKTTNIILIAIVSIIVIVAGAWLFMSV